MRLFIWERITNLHMCTKHKHTYNFDDIKFIIWDLDNTFWNGTLSEGGIISCIPMNIALLRRSVDCGIINSICSKNIEDEALEWLSTMQVADYFIWPSINWEAKGSRLKKLIEKLGFRAENTLFIDDSLMNQCEAQYYLPGILTAGPNIIPLLYDYYLKRIPFDKSHRKLAMYKSIECREKAKEQDNDNISFLFQSNIIVEIHDDCIAVEDRIHELIIKTNQLNYTKRRLSRNDLRELLNSEDVYNGYVTAKDKYVDYGIIGFFSLKEGLCLHFLFSCRVIGLGVEDWVYHKLNKPYIEIEGPVVHPIGDSLISPQWINQGKCIWNSKLDLCMKGNILFKGPCDIQALSSYFSLKNEIHEFSYISSEKNITIEHHNHSVNYLQFPLLSCTEREYLLKEFPFNDVFMFDTRLFSDDTEMVFLSTMPETCLGVYQNRKFGYKFAWGEWNRPLTDVCRHEEYVINTKSNYGNTISLDWLAKFSKEWEYIGRISPDEYIQNLKRLFELVNAKCIVCLLLGSEIPYSRTTSEVFINMHVEHKLLNDRIREYAKENSRLKLIDFTEFIDSCDDYLDNINHFQRRVYYKAAKIAKIILTQHTFN